MKPWTTGGRRFSLEHDRNSLLFLAEAQMNLGNKLAVGEAVDLGATEHVDEPAVEIAAEVPAVRAEAVEPVVAQPVVAHAEH